MSDTGYSGSRGRRGRTVRLFGFNLTMTSSLLLFISAVVMMILGIYGVYQSLTIWNDTAIFPTAYFIIYFILIVFATYIFFQTIRFRRSNV